MAITGVSTIILSLCLSYFFAEIGAAIAYVFAEFILLILILRIYKVKRL
ncbi:putative membrane protein [Escherichia coli DEC10A]|nr:putative membrane protein [Escherichia coli DEC9E]EHW62069.1 putative membrane protein [Escherichia coli DEC10A]EHW78553.1 putative membrane protein [Escherichia coli DEC10D]